MPFEIGAPTEEEFEEFVPMLFQAMEGRSKYVNAVWPHNLTSEGCSKIVARFLTDLKKDPSVKWLKVTDTDSGKIVAASQWYFIEDTKPSESLVDGPPGTWDDDVEKERAQELWRSYMQPRWKLIRENRLPIVVLNIMATAPEFQRKGTGTLMMKQAMKIADKIDALSVVECGAGGRLLYEQHGFAIQHEYSLEISEKFSDRPTSTLFFMKRERTAAKD